jgi:CheY-like chemotaxis protein
VAGLRVLLIAQDEQLRGLLVGALRYHGAAVVVSASVPAALETVDQFRPHVVVCDCIAPTPEAFALMQKVRALEPELGHRIPTVELTESARVPSFAATMAGFQVALPKSIDPKDLASTIAQLAAVPTPG